LGGKGQRGKRGSFPSNKGGRSDNGEKKGSFITLTAPEEKGGGEKEPKEEEKGSNPRGKEKKKVRFSNKNKRTEALRRGKKMQWPEKVIAVP